MLFKTLSIATLVFAAFMTPHSQGQERAIPQMPGWPKTLGIHPILPPCRGLVFADLDKNGHLEIIASNTDGRIYAWDFTGQSMPGFPFTCIELPHYPPSVGDLDGDGDMEIVQFTRGLFSGGCIHAIDHLGAELPGFPVSLANHIMAGCPTLHDLDDDGDLEIVAGEQANPIGHLHVFEHDGTEWGGNWPVALDAVPTGTASVGDVDEDGSPEIFTLSRNSMYLLESDGSLLPGWPLQIPGSNFQFHSGALGDLDFDGDLEIVVGTYGTSSGCYVFHHDGTVFPGWPRLVGTWTSCAPTIVDLEGDGELDIIFGREGVFGATSECFWAWTSAGVMKPGFPIRMDHGGGSCGPFIVADINDDGSMEIFADHNVIEGPPGDLKGFLFGVDASGNTLPDFPLRPRGFTSTHCATIGDVDGDGDLELGLMTYDTYVDVNLYDLSEAYHPSSIAWETYHGTNRRGGLEGSGDRLHFNGHCALGETVRLIVHGEPGHRAFLWVSRGIDRFNHPAFGWFYLDRSQILCNVLFNDPIPAGGELAVPVSIPNNPAFAGMNVFIQGLVGASPAAGDGTVTNMLGRTIH